MADAKLDTDVVAVLSRAECLARALRLPPEQLDRKLYDRIDKVLRNAGGKWDKKTRTHIFPTDAAPKIAAMLGTGVSVDEKKRDQSFFTPHDLADKVAALANVAGHLVLEPSAGTGNLADACMRAGARSVTCFEINQWFMDRLRAKEYEVIWDDFLKFSPAKDALYSRIVMNPPFTKNQDIAHVRHALKWLAPGGILVAIMLNNQTRKGFVDLNVEYDPEIEEIDRGAFKESGTNVPTVIVRIELSETGKETGGVS